MNDTQLVATDYAMYENRHRYFAVNKPYNMVSQFVSSHKVKLLGDLAFDFPEGTHAIGRLDNRSEGLLLLTTNKKITRLLFEGDVPHKRVYLVQVKKLVTNEAVELLRTGVTIRVKGGGDYVTTPCDVSIVENPEAYFCDETGIKEYPPFSWLLISLTEGKYHQVRKMVAAVGHQCKRLIRVAIEDLKLERVTPGNVQELDEATFFKKLCIAKEDAISVELNSCQPT